MVHVLALALIAVLVSSAITTLPVSQFGSLFQDASALIPPAIRTNDDIVDGRIHYVKFNKNSPGVFQLDVEAIDVDSSPVKIIAKVPDGATFESSSGIIAKGVMSWPLDSFKKYPPSAFPLGFSATFTAEDAGGEQSNPVTVIIVLEEKDPEVTVTFDRNSYSFGQKALITITDPHANRNDLHQDSLTVVVDAKGAILRKIPVILEESADKPGRFYGVFTVLGIKEGSLSLSYGGKVASASTRPGAWFGSILGQVGATSQIAINDDALNKNKNSKDKVQVKVNSTSFPSGLAISLIETGPDTGLFTENVTLGSIIDQGAKKLFAKAGDKISLIYNGKKVSESTVAAGPTIKFNEQKYNITGKSSNLVSINVIDAQADKNPIKRDVITVKVKSQAEPAGIEVKLLETEHNTGNFSSFDAIALIGDQFDGLGILHVNANDVIQADYVSKSGTVSTEADVTLSLSDASGSSSGAGGGLPALEGKPIGDITIIYCDSFGGDSDADGICNDWEQGGLLRIPYPEWSDPHVFYNTCDPCAKPDHKDVFVEIDYVNGFAPLSSTIGAVKTSFNSAPVQNLDGVGGIRLHYIIDDALGYPLEKVNVWSDNDDLAGHWTLNGHTEEVTHQSDSRLVNYASPQWISSPRDRALNFHGNEAAPEYIEVANEANFDFERTTSFSVFLWVKSTSIADGLVYKVINDSTQKGWNIRIAGDGKLAASVTSNNAIADEVSEKGTMINDNNWHYVGFTYDGSGTHAGMKLYVDGMQVATSDTGNGLTGSVLNNNPVTIGARGPSDLPLTGAVDDVRIYKRALQDTEVSALYYQLGFGSANELLNSFTEIKGAWLGVGDEKYDTNARYAKRQVYHYALFMDKQAQDPKSSGNADLIGNDVVVSLGSFSNSVDQQQGTFMHELGHNLGLNHGGGASSVPSTGPPVWYADSNLNCKPNYPSVMSYTRQLTTFFSGLTASYSTGSMSPSPVPANVHNLNEGNAPRPPTGVAPVTIIRAYNNPAWTGGNTIVDWSRAIDDSNPINPRRIITSSLQTSTTTTIDWNGNGSTDSFSSTAPKIENYIADMGVTGCSINGASHPDDVRDSDDWHNMILDFRFHQPAGTLGTFASGVGSDIPEMTTEEVRDLRIMGVYAIDTAVGQLSNAAFTDPAEKANIHGELAGNSCDPDDLDTASGVVRVIPPSGQGASCNIAAFLQFDKLDQAAERLEALREKMDGSAGGDPSDDTIVAAAQEPVRRLVDGAIAAVNVELDKPYTSSGEFGVTSIYGGTTYTVKGISPTVTSAVKTFAIDPSQTLTFMLIGHGQIELQIPTSLANLTSGNIIDIDGKALMPEEQEIMVVGGYNTIKFYLPPGAQQVVIHGPVIVPEFPAAAILMLSVALVAVIVASRRSGIWSSFKV